MSYVSRSGPTGWREIYDMARNIEPYRIPGTLFIAVFPGFDKDEGKFLTRPILPVRPENLPAAEREVFETIRKSYGGRLPQCIVIERNEPIPQLFDASS